MSDGQEAGGQKQPRQISTIKDLFASLIAPDAATRFETLQAIQTQPQAALSFGVYQGHDVIDVLLAGAAGSLTSTEWMSWLGALAAFRDDRVTDFFLNALPQEESPQLIFSAARYLAECDLRLVGADSSPYCCRTKIPLVLAPSLLCCKLPLASALGPGCASLCCAIHRRSGCLFSTKPTWSSGWLSSRGHFGRMRRSRSGHRASPHGLRLRKRGPG